MLTEKIIKYWTNFVKFDDPNYSDSLISSNVEVWKPFYNSKPLKNMLAKEKLNNANYLVLNFNNTRMVSGLSKHRCEFWNNTRDSPSAVGETISVNKLSLLSLCLFSIIVFIKY